MKKESPWPGFALQTTIASYKVCLGPQLYCSALKAPFLHTPAMQKGYERQDRYPSSEGCDLLSDLALGWAVHRWQKTDTLVTYQDSCQEEDTWKKIQFAFTN